MGREKPKDAALWLTVAHRPGPDAAFVLTCTRSRVEEVARGKDPSRTFRVQVEASLLERLALEVRFSALGHGHLGAVWHICAAFKNVKRQNPETAFALLCHNEENDHGRLVTRDLFDVICLTLPANVTVASRHGRGLRATHEPIPFSSSASPHRSATRKSDLPTATATNGSCATTLVQPAGSDLNVPASSWK